MQKQWNLDALGDAKVKQSLERLGFRNKRESQGVVWTITKDKIQEAKERIGLVEPTQATLSESDFNNLNVENVSNVGSVV